MLPKLQFELMSGKKPEYRMEMLLMFLIMSLKCHVIVGYYGDKHIVICCSCMRRKREMMKQVTCRILITFISYLLHLKNN